MVDFRHSHQLLDLEDHTGNIWGNRMIDCSHSFMQTEGFKNTIYTLRHADAGAYESDLEVLHFLDRSEGSSRASQLVSKINPDCR